MNLTITSYNNVFKVKGNLIKLNVHLFQNEFQNVFERIDSLVLNIKDMKNIDSHGVNAIAKLHNEAISKKKKFSIIGFGNEELFNHFKTIQVA